MSVSTETSESVKVTVLCAVVVEVMWIVLLDGARLEVGVEEMMFEGSMVVVGSEEEEDVVVWRRDSGTVTVMVAMVVVTWDWAETSGVLLGAV